jgi:hypothetical protein
MVALVTGVEARPGFALALVVEWQGGARTVMEPPLHGLGGGVWAGSGVPPQEEGRAPARLLVMRAQAGAPFEAGEVVLAGAMGAAPGR